MTLDATQLHRLMFLLGKHEVDGLDRADEQELRALVATSYPEHARTLPASSLVSLAWGMLAAEKLGPKLRAALAEG